MFFRRRDGVIGEPVEPRARRGWRWFLVSAFGPPLVIFVWAVTLMVLARVCIGG